MTHPTLRELAGLPAAPARLADSTLVLIDCQNTYTQGIMELEGVQAALEQTAELLDRARSAGIPIIHIQHSDGPGSLYDIEGESGAIVASVAPREGEPVVVKQFPNSFVKTDLDDRLKGHNASNLVLAGFIDAHVRQLHRTRRLQSRLCPDRGGRRHRHPHPGRSGQRAGARDGHAVGEPGRDVGSVRRRGAGCGGDSGLAGR